MCCLFFPPRTVHFHMGMPLQVMTVHFHMGTLADVGSMHEPSPASCKPSQVATADLNDPSGPPSPLQTNTGTYGPEGVD